METGTVIHWLVEEGESFAEGQEILEVETDKAAVAVTAHRDGRLAHVLASVGHEVPVGAAVAVALAPGEELPADWEADEAAVDLSPKNADTVTSSVAPLADERPGTAVTASWKARAMAREAELDLRTLSGTGPDGRIVAADVDRALELLSAPQPSPQVDLSPVAANLAAALGLDPETIPGSGPQGRVMRSDVLREAAARIQQAKDSVPPRPAVHPQAVETVPLTGVRGRVSERMASSAATTARVTLSREVDASSLIGLRDRFIAQGLQVSYNDILIRVTARALRDHPDANARMGDGRIEYLDRVNVGVAVDTSRGLLVPVVVDADERSIPDLAAETHRLIEAARSGEIGPDDLTGGTFTITNLGMLGVEAFTPVINLPECCILGVGRIVPKPVVVDDGVTIAPRPMMSLSLAFDHRVIDGAPAARFLQRIVTLIEEPTLLL
jgi:pyruvate dehydrogenase E2 component (dihydrolipoamide acetyltransferase)